MMYDGTNKTGIIFKIQEINEKKYTHCKQKKKECFIRLIFLKEYIYNYVNISNWNEKEWISSKINL